LAAFRQRFRDVKFSETGKTRAKWRPYGFSPSVVLGIRKARLLRRWKIKENRVKIALTKVITQPSLGICHLLFVAVSPGVSETYE